MNSLMTSQGSLLRCNIALCDCYCNVVTKGIFNPTEITREKVTFSLLLLVTEDEDECDDEVQRMCNPTASL